MQFRAIGMVAILLLFTPCMGFAQQRVVKIQTVPYRCTGISGDHRDCPSGVYGNVFLHRTSNADRFAANKRSDTFLVYTTSDIDTKINTLNARIDQSRDSAVVLLRVTERQLRSEIVDGIASIPQRLLTDQAKAEIIEAIMQRVRAEMDLLRKDVDKQITALRDQN
jgi:hypothetical protein